MITLLHPSRGRPEQAYNNFKNWQSKAKYKNFEYLLGLDESDRTVAKYKEMYQNEGGFVKAFIGNNNSVVECTNKIARLATGNILIYLSDDFDCPMYWDELIQRATRDHEEFLLKVDDGIQPFEQTVLTIPIMSKSLYDKLGYFFYPGYRSMWCDVDLYFTTKQYHIYAPDLLFKHNHWVQHGKIDATYKHTEKNHAQGKDVYEKRKKENGW